MLIKNVLAQLVFLAAVAGAHVNSQLTTHPGVVVLGVDKSSAAKKGGVRSADVILLWRQADQEGAITSPLDLAWVERERAPRGAVTLIGRRTGADLSWTLPAPAWGIKTGPNWPEAETVYLRMRELATAHELESLVEYCRFACTQVSPNFGARSWAFLEGARWLSESDRWKKAAEFYSNAIGSSPANASHQRSLIYEKWAEVCKKHGDWSAANDHYQEALTESKRTGPESLAVAYDLYNLALIKFRLGDLSSADRFAVEALHIRRKCALTRWMSFAC